MHLVFLNQYYPPDAAPTGTMLAELAAELARNRHRVTVICARGGYAGGESEEDAWTAANPAIEVRRIGATRFGRGGVLGKLSDYASYYLGAAWTLLRKVEHPDRVVALTTPPYLSVVARLISKCRRADHAHWVMDLYPDVMVAHGMLRDGSIGHRLLLGLSRWGFGGSRCAAVLTLGPDMAARLAAHRRRAGDAPIDWVPLWAAGEANPDTDSEAAAMRQSRGWPEDELVVMYSGNMGLGHRFGEILSLINRGEPSDLGAWRLVCFGGGRRRAEIESFLKGRPDAGVELHDYAPGDSLTAHLKTADVHLVSLAPSWTGTMVPSKLQGIFEAGRPVIFIGDTASSIGRWVEESGAGRVVAAGDESGLAEALREIADPVLRRARAAAAKQFAGRVFSRHDNVARAAKRLTARG